MRSFISITILLSIFFIYSGCGKREKAGSREDKLNGIERFVIAKSGLRMRDKPDLSGKKLLTIPYGKSVDMLEETGEAVTISKVTGRWAKVTWRGKTGWVFGGFLGSSPADKAGKQLPAGLIGTYLLKKEVKPGNIPSRIHLENTVITKTVGGDMDSSAYCVVKDVEAKGRVYTIICAPRKLTKEELRIFQVDKAASNIKKIVITDKGQEGISVGKQIYEKRKG